MSEFSESTESVLASILCHAWEHLLAKPEHDRKEQPKIEDVVWLPLSVLRNKNSKFGHFRCVSILKSMHNAGYSSADAGHFATCLVEEVRVLGEDAGLEFVILDGFINVNLLQDEKEWLNSKGVFPSASCSSSTTSVTSSQNTTSVKTASASSFSFQEIGKFESCFKEKHGTPHQGAAAANTRGRIRLHSWVNARESFEGISQYSHIWVIFVFHANTNTKFHPRVRPPRLKGGKLGAYATRTPHRINPLGLTVCKLVEWEGADSLLVSGVDLIHDTPIVDVKPYHPMDIVSAHSLRTPSWIVDLPSAPLSVHILPSAKSTLKELFSTTEIGSSSPLEFYTNYEEAIVAIEQAVGLDPRTLHSHQKHTNGVYGFPLDRLDVMFRICSSPSCSSSSPSPLHSSAPTSSAISVPSVSSWLDRAATESFPGVSHMSNSENRLLKELEEAKAEIIRLKSKLSAFNKSPSSSTSSCSLFSRSTAASPEPCGAQPPVSLYSETISSPISLLSPTVASVSTLSLSREPLVIHSPQPMLATQTHSPSFEVDDDELRNNNIEFAEVFKLVYYPPGSVRPKLRTQEWHRSVT